MVLNLIVQSMSTTRQFHTSLCFMCNDNVVPIITDFKLVDRNLILYVEVHRPPSLNYIKSQKFHNRSSCRSTIKNKVVPLLGAMFAEAASLQFQYGKFMPKANRMLH